jgi:predicted DNA-binding transcriptional regulator AlpA
MPNEGQQPTILLRPDEVERRVKRPKGTLWGWAKRGQFPLPIILTPSSMRPVIAWREADIDDWLASRPMGFGPSPKVNAMRKAKAAERRASVGRLVLRRPQ